MTRTCALLIALALLLAGCGGAPSPQRPTAPIDAKAATEQVSPRTAAEAGNLILDVREAAELGAEGRIEGSLHVPRGLLEAKADPASPFRDERLVAALESGETEIGRASCRERVCQYV